MIRLCTICSTPMRSDDYRPAHSGCACPRICAGCGIQMPKQGVPRLRGGVLKCKKCDPWEPMNKTGRCRTARANGSPVLIASEPLTEDDLAALADRPRMWGDCVGETGPCPWVAWR